MHVDENYALLVSSYVDMSNELRRYHRHEVAMLMDMHSKAHREKDEKIERLTDENRRLAQRLEEMVNKQQVSDGPSFDAELRRRENAPL